MFHYYYYYYFIYIYTLTIIGGNWLASPPNSLIKTDKNNKVESVCSVKGNFTLNTDNYKQLSVID
jgi:hypothetical protein